MSFLSLAQALEALQSARLLIDEEMCINLRGRGALCRRCERACPAAALALSEDALDLDDEACTGCGACVPACPAGALRLNLFDPERFVRALGGAPEAHVHCAASRDGGGGVVIPCHLLIDRRLAAAALGEGTRVLVLHGLPACADCARGDARAHVGALRRILQRWFGEAAPELREATAGERAPGAERIHQEQPEASRRGFLRLAGLGASSATSWATAAAPEASPAPHAMEPGWRGIRHQAPLPYRAALMRRFERLPWRPGRLPSCRRSFDESCSGCMVCAERCPTGALAGEETAEARRISFDPALCTNCTLCQRICPQDAVRPRAAASLDEATSPRSLLMYRQLRPCTACGLPFVPADGQAATCDQCLNEHELDDAWFAMLEA